MKNRNKGLTVRKWVMINRTKVPRMPQNISVQIFCPSPKSLVFWWKKASLGVRSSFLHSICKCTSGSRWIFQNPKETRIHISFFNRVHRIHFPGKSVRFILSWTIMSSKSFCGLFWFFIFLICTPELTTFWNTILNIFSLRNTQDSVFFLILRGEFRTP